MNQIAWDMSLLDKNSAEYLRWYERMRNRSRRHGKDWRQIFIDCGGMCIYPEDDGLPCGSTVNLEFHEVFMEIKNPDKQKRTTRAIQSKMQQRILLCPYHHNIEHGKDNITGGNGGYSIEPHRNPNKSMLAEDVDIDILLSGGYQEWLNKYNIDDTRHSILLFSARVKQSVMELKDV